MSSRNRKRRIRIIVLAVVCVVTIVFFRLMEISLRPVAIYSGFLLFGLVFFLSLYNLRKRIRFLPIGSSESWLQLHIYVGLFTGLLFGIHVGWQWTRGVFEAVLAILYLATFCSGIFGLILSRSFAKRLASSGDEILFRRIPAKMAQVRQEVESLVLGCLSQTDSTAIPEFYADRLRTFFGGPRHIVQHIFHSSRPQVAVLGEIEGFQRYLNSDERSIMADIQEKVVLKNTLDYQYALQFTLKAWMFVHIPLTWALLVFAALHLLLIFAFAGITG